MVHTPNEWVVFSSTVVSLLLLFGPFLILYAGPPVRVVDGDTVVFNNEFARLEKVRFIAVDAPEKTQICQDSNGFPWNCGQASADRLKQIIQEEGDQGRSFVCNRDERLDSQGRTMAVCFVQDRRKPSPWVDVGKQMVREGWAFPYSAMSHMYQEEEKMAQAERLGLWKGTFDRPDQWRLKQRDVEHSSSSSSSSPSSSRKDNFFVLPVV